MKHDRICGDSGGGDAYFMVILWDLYDLMMIYGEEMAYIVENHQNMRRAPSNGMPPNLRQAMAIKFVMRDMIWVYHAQTYGHFKGDHCINLGIVRQSGPTPRGLMLNDVEC